MTAYPKKIPEIVKIHEKVMTTPPEYGIIEIYYCTLGSHTRNGGHYYAY